MQTIKIASDDTLQAPPAGQPALPGQMTTESQKQAATAGKQANSPIPNAINEADALKAVEGTKFTTLTPLTGDGGQATGTMGNSVPVGGLIDGGLAVELMDALLPSLLVALMAAIGAQMKKADLQLTAREKTTLTPLMQKCMDQLMINFQSPFAALGVSMLVIYGAKLTEKGVVQMIDKKAEKAQAERERREQQGPQTPAPNPAPVQREILKPANVVSFKPHGRPAAPISRDWEPTEEMMFIAKKIMPKKGPGEHKARLQREHAAGTLDKFLKQRQK